MRTPEGLSESERELWDAFQSGRALDLRSGDEAQDVVEHASHWGPERRIRAQVLARLVLQPEPAHRGRPAALQLTGARITGGLDLRHARIACPLTLEACSFDNTVELAQAETSFMSLRGSGMPALDGYGLRVDGDLDLSAVVATREVRLFGAHVKDRLWLVGAQLSCPDGFALNAPDMRVEGGMYCGGGFTADAGMNLYGTHVGAGLDFDGAVLIGRGRFGLRANNLITGGDVTSSNVEIRGGLSLFGAEIGGQLWLNGATLACTEGWALTAPNMTVRGGLYARSLIAAGGVNLYGTAVGAGMELSGATVRNDRGGPGLRAPHMTIDGDVTCEDQFTAAGGIDLTNARIGGELSFRGADLGGETPADLDCTSGQIATLALQNLASSPETVLLNGADIRAIREDDTFRPKRLDLDQARYGTLAPQRPVRERLHWLRLGSSGYQPWPYEQLAAHCRRLGHDEDARTVMLAKHRHRRESLRPPSKAWSWLQDAVVGYGYRPVRAFAWLGAGIAATAGYFAAHPPERTGGTHPGFSALAYATDVFLPVIDLGQQRAFAPHGPGQWVAWAAVVTGWVLATTVAAGVTRVLART